MEGVQICEAFVSQYWRVDVTSDASCAVHHDGCVLGHSSQWAWEAFCRGLIELCLQNLLFQRLVFCSQHSLGALTRSSSKNLCKYLFA